LGWADSEDGYQTYTKEKLREEYTEKMKNTKKHFPNTKKLLFCLGDKTMPGWWNW
jgi:hypothetical protein